MIRSNKVPLISRVLEQWAHLHAVTLHVIDPGKPVQNAHGERFHGWVRDECLNEHWFLGLGDARQIVETWRQDSNTERPHRALGDRTSAAFARGTNLTAASRPADGGLS